MSMLTVWSKETEMVNCASPTATYTSEMNDAPSAVTPSTLMTPDCSASETEEEGAVTESTAPDVLAFHPSGFSVTVVFVMPSATSSTSLVCPALKNCFPASG